MPRPRPGWVPSERELKAQAKAARKLANEQRKVARALGVQARNERKLARIKTAAARAEREAARENARSAAQNAAQDATRGDGEGEALHGEVDGVQRPVQPQACTPPGPCRRPGGCWCLDADDEDQGGARGSGDQVDCSCWHHVGAADCPVHPPEPDDDRPGGASSCG